MDRINIIKSEGYLTEMIHMANFNKKSEKELVLKIIEIINEVVNLSKKDDKKELLCDFFKFFRDNGENYIGLSIEQFVQLYLDAKK